ncbi:MAG: porin family protein [Muribaculaceae bacterium]|nr:porin family protein [Muribaculaceae bacterium]
MKKILLAFALIFACAVGAGAQRTELTIGYGGYTQMDASDCHDGWHGVKNAWGALTAGLNFRLTDRLWVGPSYTFSSTNTKGGPERSHIAYHVLLANGRYDYYRNGIFSLYGHLGLGVIVSYMQPYGGDSYNNTYFGVQLSPIGARAAVSRNVSLYGELGYGAQGLLQVGVRIGL